MCNSNGTEHPLYVAEWPLGGRACQDSIKTSFLHMIFELFLSFTPTAFPSPQNYY